MSLKESLKQNPDGIVTRAYAFAEKAHRKQKRKSGEPYFNHVAATAEILGQWHMDDATIAAGLLHDTVEDTGVTLDAVHKEFGGEIAFLVDGVTKLGRLKYRGAESKAENMRKMIVALSQDLRVVFIKLADRMHNMLTLAALPPAKQKRIALETSEIYAPLAYRLGMYNVSGELEDVAFSYLSPKEYEWLESTTKEQYAERLRYLENIKPEVEALLKKHGIAPVAIDFRAKRYSSLYKKLLKHNMDIGKIYDLVAMRVIVNTVSECYAVLGVIHEAWPPMPGRIKDYIALPKPNAYRSLHTTVIGPGGHIMEFQIRTKEMHEESEYGVAAHWLYQERGKNTWRGRIFGGSRERGADQKGALAGEKLASELTWVRQLREWQERISAGNGAESTSGGGTNEAGGGNGNDDASGNANGKKDSEKFLEAMKVDFFRHRIFAITPRGDVIDLPAGATPIDFAYHIHSEVGDEASGARSNGTLVPLDHELASGDMVEIIRQRGKKPSEDWLKFVKTAGARDHIRAGLRSKDEFVKSWHKPTRCVLRVVVVDRVGLIQDISAAIAQNHVNILSFHAEHPKGGRLSFERAEVQTTDAAKIKKMILKLKRIKGVKEVSYKLI